MGRFRDLEILVTKKIRHGIVQLQIKEILGCPWKLVTIVSKLGYNLLTGLTTYLYRGYNPFTKYHGHPSIPAPSSRGTILDPQKW